MTDEKKKLGRKDFVDRARQAVEARRREKSDPSFLMSAGTLFFIIYLIFMISLFLLSFSSPILPLNWGFISLHGFLVFIFSFVLSFFSETLAKYGPSALLSSFVIFYTITCNQNGTAAGCSMGLVVLLFVLPMVAAISLFAVLFQISLRKALDRLKSRRRKGEQT